MNQEHRGKVFGFLRQEKLAVIATNNPDNPTPESALIAYAEDDELRLYFQTGKDTRKAINLKTNQHVSLVIGLTLTHYITVQYEGTAQQILDHNKIEQCKERFITKGSPTTEVYFNNPNTIFFEVTPTWISYSDYSSTTPIVIEIRQFG